MMVSFFIPRYSYFGNLMIVFGYRMKYFVCSFLCQLDSLEHSLLYKLNLPYLIERILAFFICVNWLQPMLHQLGIPRGIYRGCTN